MQAHTRRDDASAMIAVPPTTDRHNMTAIFAAPGNMHSSTVPSFRTAELASLRFMEPIVGKAAPAIPLNPPETSALTAEQGLDQSASGASDQEAEGLLPRFTRVLIRGNNRTKAQLVGKEGIVKRAVGLGGWHLLVSPSR